MPKTEFMLSGSRQKLNNLSAPPALKINGTHVEAYMSSVEASNVTNVPKCNKGPKCNNF